jgi:glycopeptide antibiotics resistance protein
VEVAQMLLKVGIFDVDDILLNSIGGILGYLFFVFCNYVYRKAHEKNYKKRRK